MDYKTNSWYLEKIKKCKCISDMVHTVEWSLKRVLIPNQHAAH